MDDPPADYVLINHGTNDRHNPHLFKESYTALLDRVFARNPQASPFYFTTKAPRAYTEVAYPENTYIMFGKESRGLPEELLFANRESCVRIPMRDTLRSLNLSNSVAIAVYEILRQDEFAGLRQDGVLTRFDWADADR